MRSLEGMFLPLFFVVSRSRDKQWFDASYRRTYDVKQTAYRAWCRAHNAYHLGQFMLARAEA